ncbi:deoxyguanosinetriphosphate triphosphohydrolase-like protein [Deinococcus xinjiangensis]|uniref:Deoxyguanosinetriphosphate triphosphohydrolase-like protein n=1 Tax=Deinococcus xinjiangensis TaxID=457454 RepID=A0ABP9VIC1_9DEIO
MTTKERWTQLLSPKRLHGKPETMNPTSSRTPFDADYGRVVFSSQFRRLQDKTQVFPLAKSDYTRTRLTHTMEVASVGQGLGKYLGKLLEERKLLPDEFTPSDVGTVVAVACLAHDLGNPPFGHSGEDAIQEWAVRRKDRLLGAGKLTEDEYRDIANFEGNGVPPENWTV